MNNWKDVCAQAVDSAKGLQIRFHSKFSDYIKFNGDCEFVGAIVEPNDEFDEEALPFYLLKTSNGDVFPAGDDELHAMKPADVERLKDLMRGISLVFAASRVDGLHYPGPTALYTHGSEEEKRLFEDRMSKLSEAPLKFPLIVSWP